MPPTIKPRHEEDSTGPLVAHFSSFKGQKVALLCARFAYWGILSEVHGGFKPFIVLSYAHVVEQCGQASGVRPESADDVKGSITLFIDAIEMLFQPPWSQALMPHEEQEAKSRKSR